MRNLKKVLSLALALVMLLGMMVIGAGAAYSDADAITKTEAVDVMTALGIFEGSNGVFDPQGNLRREQAAKIVVYVSDGPAVAKALGQSATQFEDVPAAHWASGYVAYCANLGIIAGKSATVFDPRGELTAEQFAKMLLVAMGGTPADYEGAAFSANTKRDAIKAGLIENVGAFVWNKALTREQACQMALNALTKTLDGGKMQYPVIKDDGTAMYFDSANEAALYAAVIKDAKLGDPVADTTGTLGERNYGLKQEAAEDKLGNPATKWTANGDVELIIASTAPTLSIAGADFDWAKMVKDGYKTSANTKSWYNGTEVTNTAADEYFTNLNGGYGATIDLYCDGKTVTKAIVTEPYFTKVTTAAAKEGADVKLAVYEAGFARKNNGAAKTVTVTKDHSDYELVKDMAKGDVFMGVFQSGWDTGARDGKLVSIAGEPETIEGKVTATKITSGPVYTGSSITVDGTVYKFSSEYSRKTVAVKDEGTFYLFNGYVYHFEEAETEDSNDYAIALEFGKITTTGLTGGTTYQAKLLLTDGSEKIVNINKMDGKAIADSGEGKVLYSQLSNYVNTFVSYTEKDDVYALNKVVADANKGVTVSVANFASAGVTGNTATYAGQNVANAKTVFMVRTGKGTNDEKVTIYNGIAELPSMKTNAPTVSAAFAVNGIDAYVYLEATNVDSATSSKKFAYIFDKTTPTETEDGWEYDAIVGGELTTLTVAKNDTVISGLGFTKGGLVTYQTTDGLVSKADKTIEDPAAIEGIASDVLVLKTPVNGSKAWQFDSNTVVYIVENGDVTVTDMDDVTADEEGAIFVEFTSANANLAVVVWVIRG